MPVVDAETSRDLRVIVEWSTGNAIARHASKAVTCPAMGVLQFPSSAARKARSQSTAVCRDKEKISVAMRSNAERRSRPLLSKA